MSMQPIDPQHSDFRPGPELRQYLSTLDRRKWWVIVVSLLVLAGTVAYTYWTLPTYRASAIVEVAGPAYVALGSPQGQTQDQGPVIVPESSSVDTMVEIMKGPEVFHRAASAAFGAEPAARPGSMTVQRVGATNLIRIDVENTDPIRAMRFANAIASATADVNLEGRRRHFTDVRRYIETQVEETSQRLRSAEETIAQYQSQGSNVALGQKTTGDIQKISDLQTQRLALQLDIHNVEEYLRQDPASLAPAQTAPEASAAGATEIPIVRTLRDQTAKLEVELAGLRAQFTDRYPAVKEAEARLEQTKQLLQRESTNQMASLRAQLDALQAKDAVLSEAIRQIEGEVAGVPQRELELEKLAREQKVEEGNYLFLAQKLEEARLTETSVGSQVQVVSAALVPARPVKPSKTMNTLFGSLVGLCLGIGIAFGVELLDDTMRTRDDIEQTLGIPVLGVVPSVKPQKPVR